MTATLRGSDGEGGSGEVYKSNDDFTQGKAKGDETFGGSFLFPRIRVYYKISWDLNSHYAVLKQSTILGLGGYSFS